MSTWTYGGYVASVLGVSGADGAVLEHDLDTSDRRGLDEWLGVAEVEAWRVGGLGGDLPEEWAGFHARALDELCAVGVSS